VYAFATICRGLDCFTRTEIPCRIPITLRRQTAPQMLGPGAPPSVVAPCGRSSPPKDRPPFRA
jgi:hypothetical protein